ncbi:MAG: helix-turn-helix transcriptional regulator [Flavobacteriales bacterium]|nr:helix-turn-helix transcriptional regulator [Flavobacteriales bacterium]
MRLILAEHTMLEIAEILFLSLDTVETHRRNIMHKLDVRNTAGLVKYAMERGWDMQAPA